MEARQAVAVARAAGGDRFALDTMKKADIDLSNAEAFLRSGQDKKKIQTLARHVTQLAEDARLISVRKEQAEALNRERSDNERRTTELTRTAENEADRRRNAEMEAAQKNREALLAQQQAADARRTAEQVQAQSEAAIAAKDRQLAIETERARAANLAAETERMKQQNSEMEAAKARAQAEIAQREREEAAAKQRMLEQEAARARESAQAADLRNQAIEQKNKELEEQNRAAQETARRAEEERAKTRAELARQLNIVLVTRQTARGLIVNMSDVLFDTGLHTLKPGAREKLAKVAGIILAHPGLKIEVEGHADSTGGPAVNQPLSEKRAESVRSYLVSQGVDSNTITARGFGDTKPVADNGTAAGRQVNRRVELVVNGPLLTNTEPSATGVR